METPDYFGRIKNNQMNQLEQDKLAEEWQKLEQEKVGIKRKQEIEAIRKQQNEYLNSLKKLYFDLEVQQINISLDKRQAQIANQEERFEIGKREQDLSIREKNFGLETRETKLQLTYDKQKQTLENDKIIIKIEREFQKLEREKDDIIRKKNLLGDERREYEIYWKRKEADMVLRVMKENYDQLDNSQKAWVKRELDRLDAGDDFFRV